MRKEVKHLLKMIEESKYETECVEKLWPDSNLDSIFFYKKIRMLRDGVCYNHTFNNEQMIEEFGNVLRLETIEIEDTNFWGKKIKRSSEVVYHNLTNEEFDYLIEVIELKNNDPKKRLCKELKISEESFDYLLEVITKVFVRELNKNKN